MMHSSKKRPTPMVALCAVLIVSAAVACGNNSGEDEADRGIVGSWFRCEFVDSTNPGASPSDGCEMLDDDGLRFAADGTVFSIEAANSPENVCNKGVRGKCFPRDTADLQIDEKVKGSYEVEGDSVRMLYNSGNEATFELRSAEGYHLFDNYVVKKPTGDEPKPKYRHMYRYR